MNAALRSVIETKLGRCSERIVSLRAMLTELAEEVEGLQRIVAESDADSETEALRAMLELHQTEMMRLLARDRDQPVAPTAPETAPDTAPPQRFPFRLDPFNREVRIGRRRVLLTPREMKVMELLWEQMPAPVSREDILERLYGDGAARSERVVDVHIHNVRQKLRATGSSDVSIKSWAGQGWALVLPSTAEGSANPAFAGRDPGRAERRGDPVALAGREMRRASED